MVHYRRFFFSFGYSITKSSYISKFHPKQNPKQLHSNIDFLENQKPFSLENFKNSDFRNKNQIRKDKKIIYVPSYKDSNLRLKINYSQAQNLKNQAIFKKNQIFFTKEDLSTLIKTLWNTKKPKSSKVEAD